MPRILQNIESTILIIAEDMFREKGFQNSDMREIAQKSGIAVGTIYHYYKNKEELYIQVVLNSWRNISSSLNEISLTENDPRLMLEKMLLTLITEMGNRKSMHELWAEINSIYQDTGIHFRGSEENLHQMMAKQFGQAILKMFAEKNDVNNKELSKRLGSYAFVMAIDTCMLPKDQARFQVKVITDMLLAYIEKRNLLTMNTRVD